MDFRAMVSLLLLLLLGLSTAQPGVDHDGENDIVEAETDMEDITSIILRMNNGSTDFLLEGDVLIPRTRSAMKCFSKTFSCLWPKSASGKVKIPFKISSKYDRKQKKVILNAMKDFKSKTCIRFVPRVNQKIYISIEPRRGCFSSLGRTGRKQVVSLDKRGCVYNGVVQHELLHAMGFYHEHTRSDRDKYVKINWENIKKRYSYNFRKSNGDNLNTPYDYSSVMQYGKSAFVTARGKESITPIPDPTVAIGQRRGMSDIDILRINKLYKCSEKPTKCGSRNRG